MSLFHRLFHPEHQPRDWDRFAGDGAAVQASGLGRLEFAAPFIPTLPGTDEYVDQLR